MLLFAFLVSFLVIIPGVLPATFAQTVLPSVITKMNSNAWAGYVLGTSIPDSITMPGVITKMNSTAWAGYDLGTSNPNSITMIQGSWVVPTVTCGSGEDDNAWYDVNLQGNSGGTHFGCTSGVASYGPFCEFLGLETCPSISPGDTVSPGDKMKAVVAMSYTNHLATVTLMDTTKSWTYIYSTTETGTISSGNWILENSPPLPNFGVIKTSGNLATAGTHHGTLKSFNSLSGDKVTQYTLVDSVNNVMASASSLSTIGSAFSVNWKPLYSNYGCLDDQATGITCSWLEQQAMTWAPKPPATNASIGWTVEFTDASYNNIQQHHESYQTLLNELNMLLQSGATCIRIDIGYDAWLPGITYNPTIQNWITSLVSQIKSDGKCLIIADAGANSYRQNQLTMDQFEIASISRVQTLASLYHPDFYIVVKEPFWYFSMLKDNTSAPVTTASVWAQLAQDLSNAVVQVSPKTEAGVSTSFGAAPTGVATGFTTSFLSGANGIGNLSFIGFDLYSTNDFTNASTAAMNPTTKSLWIAEAWSTSNATLALSADRMSLDQLWIQDLYYFGLYIHATNINPFYTNCFASYSPDDTSYSTRTPVFYEYQHLATSYDGRVH